MSSFKPGECILTMSDGVYTARMQLVNNDTKRHHNCAIDVSIRFLLLRMSNCYQCNVLCLFEVILIHWVWYYYHRHIHNSLFQPIFILPLLSSLTSLLSLTFPLSHYKIRVMPSPLFFSTLDSPPPFFVLSPPPSQIHAGTNIYVILRVSMIPSLSLFSLDREKAGFDRRALSAFPDNSYREGLVRRSGYILHLSIHPYSSSPP